ncbi:uncharacterized protein LOC135465914 [Liolophura sinensis]|uniref:uncharacterized protein LOC135465914 n=1 Tax=Liolophura sinensis TaxID=3198878 RepID=UPI003158BC2D
MIVGVEPCNMAATINIRNWEIMEENARANLLRVKLFTSMAEIMREKNPTLERMYRVRMLELMQRMQAPSQKSMSVCPFCGECFLDNPDSVTVRYRPKLAQSQVHFKPVGSNVPLGRWKQSWLSLYRRSTTQMVTKCSLCGKQQITKGPDRSLSNFRRSKCRVQSSVEATPLLKGKRKRKEKAKLKRKQKLMRMSDSNLSVSMETDSGLDSSHLSLGSPIISSTPKPLDLLSTSTGSDSLLLEKTAPPTLALFKLNPGKSSGKSPQSRSQLLSSASLLDDSKNRIQQRPKKKKKTKDLHLQLQKIFKKDNNSNSSTGSLKDFLSSI